MADTRDDRLESKIDKIDAKTDRLDERLDRIDVHMAVYNEQLKIHIEGVKQVREENAALAAEVKPIARKVHYAEGAIKFIGLIAVIGGIIEVISLIARQLQ